MKNIFRVIVLPLLSFALISNQGFSEEYKYSNKSSQIIKSTAAACATPSGFRFLHTNNVRARINTGGDMWWNLVDFSQYYIPANGSATSMFSGSLWIGGTDINGQLKLAALRYRQVGQDYWTGPLTTDGTAAVDVETCSKWDKFFVVKRSEVNEFIQWFSSDNKEEDFPGYAIPESIMEYPAHGDESKGQSYYMAPFVDVDGDCNYDPNAGDYPYYDIANDLCPLNVADPADYIPYPTMESDVSDTACLDFPVSYGGLLVDQVLKGDETFWWVFNDKGDQHSETEGDPIGMEIRAQAFAFATNDEINNMTFYSYEIINRSTYVLTNTFFSPWVDTDLGYAWDDFVGCDVNRGLGYCYNGLPIDGGGEPEAYGDQPPAIGVDFFQGPYMDPDGYDNPSFNGDGYLGPSFFGDCSIVGFNESVIQMPYINAQGNDTTGQFLVKSEAINGVNFGNGIVNDERFGMRRFVYHNNGGIADMSDPAIAPEYYLFLQGKWKNNQRMLYGGNAYNAAGGAVGPETDFMFPGDSDPCNWGTQGQPPGAPYGEGGIIWTEETGDGTTPNTPFDRRFMQSAGPFTLLPGAVNYITVGIPWARAISGGPWASVELLRVVDDKCQALFDNCFKLIDGPDAPDLTFQELNNEIIVYISNSEASNNYKERYSELDPQIRAVKPDTVPSEDWDSYYHFEGYQIFQLRDANITLAESRYDPDRVRLVAQVDIKNGISKLVNFKFDRAIGANVPVIEVDGNDGGIVHSFTIYDDQFASGDSRLINHKQYYYSAIAYGYNNYKDYDPTLPTQLDGQKKPYLSGRKGADGEEIPVYTVIPHKIVNGTVMNSVYGDGPQVTRLEGQGSGNMILELTEKTIEEILKQPPAKLILYDSVWRYNYGEQDYPISYNPVYKYGNGPINVKVIDPLNVKAANYILEFDTEFFDYKFTDAVGNEGLELDSIAVQSTRSWVLIDQDDKKNPYPSDTSTSYNNEQLFPELGLSVTFGLVYEPGSYRIGNLSGTANVFYHNFADNNGLLESSVEYADSSERWLDGVSDNDVPGSPRNWIRSGTYNDIFVPNNNDWDVSGGEPWDPNAAYEKIANGTWAPYAMCSSDDQDGSGAAPVHSSLSKEPINNLRDIASVDIVLTSDQTKWSRCPVIEMCSDESLSIGAAEKFGLRLSPSVNKDGVKSDWPADTTISDNPEDPNYIFPYGMGWFPGYAINLETGERLNIMFGEDSWLVGENGRDMLFNPTSSIADYPSGEPLFGGKHYVYIMGHNTYTIDVGATFTRDFPAYDAGSLLANTIEYDTIPIADRYMTRACAMASTMYVGMPLSNPDKEWLNNDVRIRIRIGKPYDRFYSQALDSAFIDSTNLHYPRYKFSTEGIATTFDNTDKVESDLDLINVVPNPYYAYSEYERNQLDNRVKLTNLPEKCTVTIYNSTGTLIRQYTKDDPITFLDWDLKNHAGIPIAGGIYIIHVINEGSGGGERIIKWFGSLRIEDFNQF